MIIKGYNTFLSDKDTTTFSNMFNKLNSAENTLQTFINMIFNIDTLYAIGNNNDIKILQTINNILYMKFVKDYFLLNGGVAQKKYKQLLDDAKNFNYKTQQSKQSNKLQFIDQYNIYSTKFQEFFKTMSDKLQLLENTVYACQLYKMDTSRNDTVTSTKLNIFNKILEYLKQYNKKDTIYEAY